jgi:hypothetical protein
MAAVADNDIFWYAVPVYDLHRSSIDTHTHTQREKERELQAEFSSKQFSSKKKKKISKQ